MDTNDPATAPAGVPAPPRAGRNLVICFDGTNNRFGPENTNVIRLVQSLDRDPARQRLYYDPGVGTFPRPEKGRLGELLSRVPGLAFGAGLERNVEEAYTYLLDNWEPGDRVFVFGFSRGSYTARVFAGLLHLLGLLPRGNVNMLPYAMQLFRAVRADKKAYKKLCDDFRWTFARPAREGDDERHFPVHFLGVWDTVSSVGWVWNPTTYRYTSRNPSIATVRHALALDERRWFYRQNQMRQAGTQNFQEMWFAGVHSDVGGGYGEAEGGLWRISFEWMVREAATAGLLLDAGRLEQVRTKTDPPREPWAEPQHESLEGAWWIGEYVPKERWSYREKRTRLRIGRGRRRFVPNGSRIHESVLLRIRDPHLKYAPPNLSQAFIEEVRGLRDVPPWLESF
jgi:uncharacterized protein (DUF2235 family)